MSLNVRPSDAARRAYELRNARSLQSGLEAYTHRNSRHVHAQRCANAFVDSVNLTAQQNATQQALDIDYSAARLRDSLNHVGAKERIQRRRIEQQEGLERYIHNGTAAADEHTLMGVGREEAAHRSRLEVEQDIAREDLYSRPRHHDPVGYHGTSVRHVFSLREGLRATQGDSFGGTSELGDGFYTSTDREAVQRMAAVRAEVERDPRLAVMNVTADRRGMRDIDLGATSGLFPSGPDHPRGHYDRDIVRSRSATMGAPQIKFNASALAGNRVRAEFLETVSTRREIPFVNAAADLGQARRGVIRAENMSRRSIEGQEDRARRGFRQ